MGANDLLLDNPGNTFAGAVLLVAGDFATLVTGDTTLTLGADVGGTLNVQAPGALALTPEGTVLLAAVECDTTARSTDR